jgi:hypothetical protein
MKFRRLVIAGLTAGVLLTTAACGGGDDSTDDPAETTTTTVEPTATTEHDMSQMEPGETMPEDYEGE